MATQSATRSASRTSTAANTMSKDELIHQVAARCGLSLKDTTNAINAFADTICRNIAQGKAVGLIGFGKFQAITVAAHRTKSIATKQYQMLPASKRVSFSAGSDLKSAARGRYTANTAANASSTANARNSNWNSKASTRSGR